MRFCGWVLIVGKVLVVWYIFVKIFVGGGVEVEGFVVVLVCFVFCGSIGSFLGFIYIF